MSMAIQLSSGGPSNNTGFIDMISAITCMAIALYFEARGEPVVGQIAVGHVIMNRASDNRYPGEICDVVTQGPTYRWKPELPIKHRCQFSFWCDGRSDEPKDKEVYGKAVFLSEQILNSDLADPTEGSTHYHATSVLPGWAKSKTSVVRIDNHIFYRWEK